VERLAGIFTCICTTSSPSGRSIVSAVRPCSSSATLPSSGAVWRSRRTYPPLSHATSAVATPPASHDPPPPRPACASGACGAGGGGGASIGAAQHRTPDSAHAYLPRAASPRPRTPRAWRGSSPPVRIGYLLGRGGGQHRWHSLVRCDHGDSTTSRSDSPTGPCRRRSCRGTPPPPRPRPPGCR
jgi:hypothetical protein